MKRMILSSLLTIELLNATGIPVVDAVANAQAMAQNVKTVAEYAEQAKRWVDTANHYQSQLKAYNDQLVSQTGVEIVCYLFKILMILINSQNRIVRIF